jgi:DNA invertase Pin-like site-specific DNA recombinase
MDAYSMRRQEGPPDLRPVAYGYLRAEHPQDLGAEALRLALGCFCEAQEWRLVTVFCDRDCDGSETARVGFTAVLDVLRLPSSALLVVPSLEHLSPDALVREGLLRQVQRTGARLVVVDEHQDQGTAKPGRRSGEGS